MSAQTQGESPFADPQKPCPPPYILLIGPPGSGKTKWAMRHFDRNAITSLDQHRAHVGGSRGNQAATPYAVRIQQALVEGRLQFGQTVVVDNTNADPGHRKPLLEAGYLTMRPPIAIVFDTPLEVCEERNKRRPLDRRVDVAFLRDTHAAIREQFPVETTWIPTGFAGGAWVIHNDGMRVGGSTIMDSARYGYAAADWLDEGREPRPASWPATEKFPCFRRSGRAIQLEHATATSATSATD